MAGVKNLRDKKNLSTPNIFYLLNENERIIFLHFSVYAKRTLKIL